jgi:hypothetical protein
MLRYQMFIKKLWRAIVNSDPITVMQIQYDKWVRARNKLNENIILMQSAETELKNVFVDINDMIYDKYGHPYTNRDEMLRRLYVACSRASNQLVLSYGK